jgi:TPR repeat protein
MTPEHQTPETKGGANPGATTRSMKIVGAFPEARAEDEANRPSRAKYWIFGTLALLLLGGTFAYYFLYPMGEGLRSAADAPPVVRPYLDRAAQGDPNAMRMLGTMYYNGLNIRQDRKEGVRWFRKAAAAGSVAARRDLEQLGLQVEEK